MTEKSKDIRTVLAFMMEYGRTGSLPNMDEGGSGDAAYEAARRLSGFTTERDIKDLADGIGRLTYIEIDQLVDAMFAKSETLPYTFNRAIHCNLKKREESLRDEVLDMSR